MTVKKEIPIPEHRDFLERKITVGDTVVVVIHNSFRLAKVQRMTPKMVRILLWYTSGYDSGGTIRYPHEMFIVDSAYVTMYMIKHSKV